MPNPEALRNQAKKLLEEAVKIERERMIKIGTLTVKYLAQKDFNLDKFRGEVAMITRGKS